jgi:hypothetical protein
MCVSRTESASTSARDGMLACARSCDIAFSVALRVNPAAIKPGFAISELSSE